VYFDPRADVAVLRVPGLDATPLAFADAEAGTGDAAAVAGYPLGGPYQVAAARVRALIIGRGEDIYGSSGVDREVYAFRGEVRHGNSGGPLLDPTGRVLGMVFGTDVREGETGYALTGASLGAVIHGATDLGKPVDTGPCRIRE
jgi:S1-C subfamily serine protease